MKYRATELLAAKSITTAGTEVLEVNVKEPISRISIYVQLTNSSWTPTGHPAKAIKQVDLVDGSDSLHSLRGIYSQAMAWYGAREQPYNAINYTDNGKSKAVVPIYFGRYLYDRRLALDPSRFNNLQLKIAHDYSLGGAVPDAATLEVWADLFDEDPPAPEGFLEATSLWTKTLVASTTDYVDIPTDKVIRMLMPAVSSDSEEPDVNIDSVKLTEDHDKRTLYDMATAVALKTVEARYPLFTEYGEGRSLANNDISFFLTQAKDVMMSILATEDSDAIFHTPWSGGQKRIIDGSLTATINLLLAGRCPHGAIPIPMGRIDEIDDWWDVTKVGSARMKMVTGGGDTSALYELLAQQLRRY